jgi:GMP synthase (glutamine-hydrolysing)
LRLTEKVGSLPKDFTVTATTSTAPFAAVECGEKHIYGIQFHPEVAHTPQGTLLAVVNGKAA